MTQRINPASTSPSNAGSSSANGPEGSRKGVADAATGMGRDVTRQVGQLADEARQTVEARASTTKDRAAGSLDTVARALRKAGDHLRADDQSSVSEYVGRAADQVGRVSGYLRSRTLGEVVGDVERFARREPALFIGGAFALGLLGGRFLKSSAPQSPMNPRSQPGESSKPDFFAQGAMRGGRSALPSGGQPGEILKEEATKENEGRPGENKGGGAGPKGSGNA